MLIMFALTVVVERWNRLFEIDRNPFKSLEEDLCRISTDKDAWERFLSFCGKKNNPKKTLSQKVYENLGMSDTETMMNAMGVAGDRSAGQTLDPDEIFYRASVGERLNVTTDGDTGRCSLVLAHDRVAIYRDNCSAGSEIHIHDENIYFPSEARPANAVVTNFTIAVGTGEFSEIVIDFVTIPNQTIPARPVLDTSIDDMVNHPMHLSFRTQFPNGYHLDPSIAVNSYQGIELGTLVTATPDGEFVMPAGDNDEPLGRVVRLYADVDSVEVVVNMAGPNDYQYRMQA